MRYKRILIQSAVLGFAILVQSCSSQKMMARKVQKEFKKSEIVDKHHVGFALYDLAEDKMIYMRDGHKYFTPASNTKLFTFYASLKMLPEEVAALKYLERGDSLIFWGTGDPSFLQSQLKGKQAYDLLKGTNKQLFFAPGRYSGEFYGAGWQWDDYNDYYQAEIDELPIMDNLVRVSAAANDQLKVVPPSFSTNISLDSTKKGGFKVTRNFLENTFTYPAGKAPANFNQQIPFKVSTALTIKLLSDTLHKPVGLVNYPMPAVVNTVKGLKRDSVLKEMMLPSDNFIAEQLLLLCSDQLGTELNTAKTIAHIQKTYLAGLPDKLVWVDGSGLSRYNLFTPADVVKVLELIYKEFRNPKTLFNLLPAGGKTGTLKNAYPKTDQPFVFGKTGTISNNHNQSGYILTKKGKTYIYAFMNNNFTSPTADVRKEMARIVTFIHDNY